MFHSVYCVINLSVLGAGKYVREELAASLKNTLFSLIIDESTDVEVRSQLGIVSLSWSWKEGSLVARLFDLVEAKSGTAEALTDAVLESVDKKGIPRDKYVSIVDSKDPAITFL